MLHKSTRPVRSIGSAETIASGFSIDQRKLIAKSYEELLDIKTSLGIAVYSMDLQKPVTTCHEPSDKSVSTDIKVIRYEFETKNVNWMTWLPGKITLADPLSKKDSLMVKPLQLLMYTGEIPIDLSAQKIRDCSQSMG